MIEKRIKTAQVKLRLAPELKAAAERAAADDHRSLTSLIEKLLSDHLKAKGYLDDEPPRGNVQVAEAEIPTGDPVVPTTRRSVVAKALTRKRT